MKNTLEDLKTLALNEIRYRGQLNGWRTIQIGATAWDLSDEEAKVVAFLVQEATVELPVIPESLFQALLDSK